MIILRLRPRLQTSCIVPIPSRLDSCGAHHSFAESNEDPKFTVRQLGPWIRHTHLKDSVGKGVDRKYVLTGRGNVPIKEQIAALRSIDYKGFYCFEWEKVWHPDLEDPEIAIADYARAVADYLR